jgi:hypothetical protein
MKGRRGHCLFGFYLAPCVASAASAAACAPPPGFRDSPLPPIATASRLVSHTEQIVIPRSHRTVFAAMQIPPDKTIHQTGSLPGVAGDYLLRGATYGAPGTRLIVCLTDGPTTEEESLAREGCPGAGHFRCIVWNYTTPRARPVAYGIDDFRTAALDARHARITWTYSFKLRDNTFPGDLGALGRWLFEVYFLDRDYAAMMRGVLRGYAATAEAQPPVAPPPPLHR